jgi:hypothetical protein
MMVMVVHRGTACRAPLKCETKIEMIKTNPFKPIPGIKPGVFKAG